MRSCSRTTTSPNWGPKFEPKLTKMVEQARANKNVKFVVVEVDHVDDQLDRVLTIPGVDIILLDNMGQWQLRHAVELRDQDRQKTSAGSQRQYYAE